nr:hypothetical protein OH826_10470 [Streptomyces sp. NBC_00899]WSX79679.1 hypothetical protein OH826_41035 [Streptomyces sp. NBC_00899]
MLIAVAEHEAEQVLEAQQPHLGGLTAWESWQKWREAVINRLINRYAEPGQRCPPGSLTSELGKSSPQARAVASKPYDAWKEAPLRGVEALTSARRLARRGGTCPASAARMDLTVLFLGIIGL